MYVKEKAWRTERKEDNIRREDSGTECCYRKTESFEKISQKGHAFFPHAPFEVKELLFTLVSITPLIDTEAVCFDLNASRPIAKGDLRWRDALLVAHRVNSNVKEGTDISIRRSRIHYRRIRIHYCPIRRSSKEEG